MLGLVFVVVMAVFVGTTAVASLQGGGTSIATAPTIPLGQHIVDGSSQADGNGHVRLFWRVPLAPSDQLRIDYGPTNGNGVELDLFAPPVTDYTFRDTNPLASDSTGTKREMKFVAPSAGRYTLEVTTYYQLAYEMTAYVRHHTTTSLTVPKLVSAYASLPIRGAVSGATDARLLLRVAGPRGFKRKAVRPINGSGAFSWATKIGSSGRYRVRAIYYGDDDHLASSASRTVRAG